jgi:hypothetical protein
MREVASKIVISSDFMPDTMMNCLTLFCISFEDLLLLLKASGISREN